ncbi:MAG: Ig-like domain-containing protein [Mycolicibacterium sp.]|uniref:Ig-like domain-containing protein n=1 Tax=Mycolicibacterium sp. TaxID=2320850 RepID=UPI003D12441D
MAVSRGRCSGRGGPRQAASLPVLRWLRVGAVAAGVGVALVAAPGVANADTGTTSSGSESSQGADADAGPSSSPGADAGVAAAADSDGSADATDEDIAAPVEDETSADPQDDADAIPVEADPETDDDPSDPAAGQGSASGVPDATADNHDDASNASADDSSDRGQDMLAAIRETTDASEDSSVTSASSESGTPDPLDGKAIASNPTTTRAVSPVAFSQSAVDSPAAFASSMSQPDYPEWVSAPVTWRSILTEGLSWLGLGALAPNLLVPQLPVPDLIAGLWMGMRRLHYTVFNSAPRLAPSGYLADPFTGVITGNLGAVDPDGDVITYRVTNAPVHGVLEIADDGTYTYTPHGEFAVAGGSDAFTVVADDTGAANPWHLRSTGLVAGLAKLLTRMGMTESAGSSVATVNLIGLPVLCKAGEEGCASTASNSPSVTIHNNSEKTIWVYNLPNSGNYSITDPPVVPISIAKGSSAAVTLAVFNGNAGSPGNRIYIAEADEHGNGFTLPVSSLDPFNPTIPTAKNSFHNYSFVEYSLYSANGGYEYTIDTSYIDEWSLPIQSKFTIPNGVQWSGAVSGKTYGFNDFDTVVSQLTAAGAHMPDGGPYKDLVWSGSTPWVPQPPATVSRIIGPDKVWAEQSGQGPGNINMNNAGWVPTSYQEFVQYGATTNPQTHVTTYPYRYNGNVYSATIDNFNFWLYQVSAPAGTPYPIALRTAAKLDGFPGVNGVWGFFTYPNDEAAGQFTNIPNSVSMDIYVNGSADGVSDSLIEGGKWLYSSSPSRSDADLLKPGRNMLVGTDSTDTFILDYIYKSRRATPLVIAQGFEHDIIAIDKTALRGAVSNEVEIVDFFVPLGCGFANYSSQFVYERSSGLLYYDEDPGWFGYTGILANLSLSQIDPSHAVFVL